MKTPEQIATEIVDQFSWPSNVMRNGRLVGQQFIVAEAIAAAIRQDRQEHGEAMRILGARDGYAGTMVHLRHGELGSLVGTYSPRIHPRHVKKLAARDAITKPLRRIEAWLVERHAACVAAYKQRTDG